ncbi:MULTISPECIES: ABC transporter ATP-binding protein [Photobacterium]|uniref:ABC transporter n=1 Tax=Photobacterium iliopiscarium TaxID=56192 RepID=A0A2T3MBI6_9GAMM|nr:MULTISPECIES: ABC transporter ATP-binding protein [Photobacterium]KAE8177905.1 ABC transporter [Photobacterium carnosum]MCD9529049.1 ATP-binding cassette domain-containing protein [Photobacterium carnosum]MCD9538709.1 ATP-binding cassette domain-containing protein [Photobacterium carnosum]MCF2155213.1 ATP-binding cassette domain-containing protein [Photobacterium carnosum]MCF2163443.1 ATP-binding cassette domain-containing protein [Photobacterium carnosum]
MSISVIKAHAVSKQVTTTLSPMTILQDVSLEVEQGESIALVGVSGAGKSTLMTLLAGLDVPTTGEIELLGHNLTRLDDEQRAQLRSESIGFVFQNFLLLPTLNALENVTLPCLIQNKAIDIERAKQLLAVVGLQGRETHLPSQLSGGEQQRVALARAFMINPKILFADEPTGNLDQQTAAMVIELLFELNRDNGTTLILVTHDDALAARCDRVLRLDNGILNQAQDRADNKPLNKDDRDV